MTVLQSVIKNHNTKFAFQLQRVYTSTQQLRYGMGSLRHTFQLRLVVSRGHCRLCCKCLPGTYKLRPWEETEPVCVRHIVLHSRMFLSARSATKILFFNFLVSIYFHPCIKISFLSFIRVKFIISFFRMFPSSSSLNTFYWPTFIWTILPLYFHFHCVLKPKMDSLQICWQWLSKFGLASSEYCADQKALMLIC